ncbi:MAG: hypothetical protein ACOCP8_05115 [archaeon]
MNKKQIKDFIINKIKTRIKRDEENFKIYKEVLNLLPQFQDKKITKRIANKIQKALPDYNIIYDDDCFNNITLKIQANDEDEFKHFTLGHKCFQDKTNPYFDIKIFVHKNICYGKAALQRIKDNKEILNNNKVLDDMCEGIERLLKAREDIQKAKTKINNYNKDVIQYGFLFDVKKKFDIDFD